MEIKMTNATNNAKQRNHEDLLQSELRFAQGARWQNRLVSSQKLASTPVVARRQTCVSAVLVVAIGGRMGGIGEEFWGWGEFGRPKSWTRGYRVGQRVG